MTRTVGGGQLDRIVRAAADALGARGYYGATIQQISDAVGLSKAGLLHYVGDKRTLMEMAVEWYDNDLRESLARSGRHTPAVAGYSLPKVMRRLAAYNAGRPALVRMFTILNAEAISSQSPFHDYFARRDDSIVAELMECRWRMPRGVDSRDLVATCLDTMDGLQTRWLRGGSGADLPGLWGRAERALFPLPQWGEYL